MSKLISQVLSIHKKASDVMRMHAQLGFRKQLQRGLCTHTCQNSCADAAHTAGLSALGAAEELEEKSLAQPRAVLRLWRWLAAGTAAALALGTRHPPLETCLGTSGV